jgi:hypothetical protein
MQLGALKKPAGTMQGMLQNDDVKTEHTKTEPTNDGNPIAQESEARVVKMPREHFTIEYAKHVKLVDIHFNTRVIPEVNGIVQCSDNEVHVHIIPEQEDVVEAIADMIEGVIPDVYCHRLKKSSSPIIALYADVMAAELKCELSDDGKTLSVRFDWATVLNPNVGQCES